MEHPALKAFEQQQMRKEIPYFQPGDTVRVNTRVIEGEKERIQAYEGVVVARTGGGIGETFTVRKISYGVGVERTFPIHSPRIESIKVVRRGHVRRAKLYYLRERVGKATRIKARQKQINEHMFGTQPPEMDVTTSAVTPDTGMAEANVSEANVETKE